MRAAYLESTGCLVLKEVEPPVVRSPDQVLIQVKTVGVCGSEVHAFEGTHPFRKAPVILGHEMAGIAAQATLTCARPSAFWVPSPGLVHLVKSSSHRKNPSSTYRTRFPSIRAA